MQSHFNSRTMNVDSNNIGRSWTIEKLCNNKTEYWFHEQGLEHIQIIFNYDGKHKFVDDYKPTW